MQNTPLIEGAPMPGGQMVTAEQSMGQQSMGDGPVAFSPGGRDGEPFLTVGGFELGFEDTFLLVLLGQLIVGGVRLLLEVL